MADWYYTRDGQQIGPESFEELQRMAGSGQLRDSDLVWKEGMADWQAASTLPALFADGGSPAGGVAVAAPAVAALAQPVAYASPLSYDSPGRAALHVTERALSSLKQTRPWVLFIGILNLIGAGLYIVIAVYGLAMASSNSNSSFAAGQAMGMLVGVCLYGAVGLLLVRFGNRIMDTVNLRRPTDLEAAMAAQLTFWRLVGILAIVAMAILAIMVVFLVSMGIR